MEVADEIILGLTQGDITSIVIVAIVAIMALLIIGSFLKLSAALMRLGCLIVVLAVFLFALTKMLG